MASSKEKYLELTADPKDIDVKISSWADEREQDLENYTVGTLNTMFNGRCLTIAVHQRVSAVVSRHFWRYVS